MAAPLALGRVWARVSPLGLVAIGAYVLGIVARHEYALRFHHPRHHVTSDALAISGLAQTLLDPERPQTFADTVWPPGQAAVLALSAAFDPTLGGATILQILLACLLPLPIAHAAFMAFGARAAKLALIFSALHFGFVHYAGYFLSEQLFQVGVSVAIWASVAALSTNTLGWRVAAGLVAGVCWGAAAAFRPNALPVALFVGLCLSLRYARLRDRVALAGLAAGFVGLLLVTAPFADRCTGLMGGRFCVGSSNFAMNVALGQIGEHAGAHFVAGPDAIDKGTAGWTPPARLHHGFSGTETIPVSMYDTSALLGWVKDRFLEHPFDFAVSAVGNAFDLFGLDYWPDDYGGIPKRRVILAKQLFLFFVLVPALVAATRLLRRRPLAPVAAFCLAAIGGVFLLAMASLGEARYRIPFDGIFILLAAGLYARAEPRDRVLARAERGLLVGVGVLVAVAAAAIALTAHPKTLLAAKLDPAVERPARVFRTLSIADLGIPKPPGSAWDAAGNAVIPCGRGCPELRIDVGYEERSETLQISCDHNDRYRVIFYKQGERIAHADWGFVGGGTGLRIATVKVPEPARSLGYDQLGIRPLYGDGRYSIGHILRYR